MRARSRALAVHRAGVLVPACTHAPGHANAEPLATTETGVGPAAAAVCTRSAGYVLGDAFGDVGMPLRCSRHVDPATLQAGGVRLALAAGSLSAARDDPDFSTVVALSSPESCSGEPRT